MKIIISPAKKLNIDAKTQHQPMSFAFLEEAKELISQLKILSILELQKLMSLSDNLSRLNYQRFQDWDYSNFSTYKAIELFNGVVYESMDVPSFSKKHHDFAQSHLRILSGLYGILKPQDLILPYRLEMGTKFSNTKGYNLYQYWGDTLFNEMSRDLDNQVLINLASDEYSKSLKLNKLNNIITPVFKDFKNGKLKVISFFAKKARGKMCKFIIKNHITDVDELKLFSDDGYSYSETSGGRFTFVRS